MRLPVCLLTGTAFNLFENFAGALIRRVRVNFISEEKCCGIVAIKTRGSYPKFD